MLNRLPETGGDEYWAPEVAYRRGAWWMYYSVGHGINGHHLRVAHATDPTGPFTDTGHNLTPTEAFAIDAHPFRDDDGRWYLYFARDVLDDPRPGTHLAVARLLTPTRLGQIRPSCSPMRTGSSTSGAGGCTGSRHTGRTRHDGLPLVGRLSHRATVAHRSCRVHTGWSQGGPAPRIALHTRAGPGSR